MARTLQMPTPSDIRDLVDGEKLFAYVALCGRRSGDSTQLVVVSYQYKDPNYKDDVRTLEISASSDSIHG